MAARHNPQLEKMFAHIWYPSRGSHPLPDSSGSDTPLPPTPRTASRCAAQVSRGAHVFEISDYSLLRGLGVGCSLRSATFAVGGYDWSLRFYPDGSDEVDAKDHVSLDLELMTADTKVRASYDVGIVHQITGEPWMVGPRTVEFNTTEGFSRWCHASFLERSELEASPYLRHDRVAIECVLTVIKEIRVSEARDVSGIEVPPSDLPEHLGRLLEEREGADVTFEVNGESFPAHRMVLSMRSPVFKAELQGSMREKDMGRITIRDMQPAVFRALLHFIYTDYLPLPDADLDKDDDREMTRHLLIAADRYAMERLKLMCEQILSRSLEVDTVSTTLALADRHHCRGLKDACIDFIISSDRIDDVVKTQGYTYLKRARPSVLLEVLERAGEVCKSSSQII